MSHEKKEQSVVLYMQAAMNPHRGFHCGSCIMGLKDTDECSILEPPNIDLEYGVCGLFVPGENTTSKKHPPMEIVPKNVAGYFEGAPTYCGVCRYFIPPDACKEVKGKIEHWGCCNNWSS